MEPDRLAAARTTARALLAERAVVPARDAYKALLAAAPGDPEALLRLAQILRGLGDLDEADRHLAAAEAAAPADPAVRAEAGRVRWRAADDEAAIPHLEAALTAAPADLPTAGMLAASYAAVGRGEAIDGLWTGALRAGMPWEPSALRAGVREALVDPAAYAGLFRAAAGLAGGTAGEGLARRGGDPKPGDPPDLPEPWRALLAMPEPRRLSACMIVKDEARNLGRALDALRGVVDELVVVDTGSADGTVAIAEAHGARIGRFAWCDDFAAARNASLELATGDWLMIYDADHAVDPRCRRTFRTWLQGLHHGPETAELQAFAFQIAEHTADGSEATLVRNHMAMLFPRDPTIRYAGRLHEQIQDLRPDPRPLVGRIVPDLVVHHYGYTPSNLAHHDKHARNLRILEAERAVRHDDPFVVYNLGVQLGIVGRHAEAEPVLGQAIALAEARGVAYQPPFLESAYMLATSACLRRGDLPAAGATAARGLRRYPACPDLRAMAGYVALRAGDDRGAYDHLAVAVSRRGLLTPHGGDPKFAGWYGELLLGVAAAMLGEAAQADGHLRAMFGLAPNLPAAAGALLGVVAERTGSRETGIAWLARVGVAVQPESP